MDQEAQEAAIEALYQEIFEHYRGRDVDLVPRQLIPETLASRVLLLGQALAEETQRLSGIPYCLPPPDSPRLSKGGRALDAFLSNFGYTIDLSNAEHQYAYHTDLAHYFPGKKRKGEFGDIRPSASDVEHDRDWFEREVRILRPRVVVALGKDPAIAFAGVNRTSKGPKRVTKVITDALASIRASSGISTASSGSGSLNFASISLSAAASRSRFAVSVAAVTSTSSVIVKPAPCNIAAIAPITT